MGYVQLHSPRALSEERRQRFVEAALQAYETEFGTARPAIAVGFLELSASSVLLGEMAGPPRPGAVILAYIDPRQPETARRAAAQRLSQAAAEATRLPPARVAVLFIPYAEIVLGRAVGEAGADDERDGEF